MKNKLKKIALILVITLGLNTVVYAQDVLYNFPSSEQASKLELGPSPKIMVNIDTGEVLVDINSDIQTPVASISKMMVHYIVLDYISQEIIFWDDEVSISSRVIAMNDMPGWSGVEIKKDVNYTVRELFEASVIASANNTSIALAEYISGSEYDFVLLMNDYAQELGLNDSKYANATGLKNEDYWSYTPDSKNPDGENIMSARDVAYLGIRLWNDFPEYREVISQKNGQMTHNIEEEEVYKYKTTNLFLLDEVSDELGVNLYNENVTGMKTGTTFSAGANLAATVSLEGKNLMLVSLNNPSDLWRYTNITNLINIYNQGNYTDQRKILEKDAYIDTMKVSGGWSQSVDVYAAENIYLDLSLSEQKNLKTRLEPINELNSNGRIKTPFEEGDIVGKLIIELPIDHGKEFISNEFDEYFIYVYAGDEAKTAPLPVRIVLAVTNFASDIIDEIGRVFSISL